MNETEFIPPRRTDALDSDDGDGAETSGFVIKPESDEEERQREQAEQQRPPPPDDDKQQTTWRRMFGRIGDAADATVKTVLLDDQERMSRPEQRFGGVVYNPRHGCIIQAIGVLTEKELGRRQEQISNSYSDNKALLAVDLPTYAVLEVWIEAAAARHEVLNFKEAVLTIQERRLDLGYIHKLAVGWGWAWAVRQIIPPPTIRPSEPKAFVAFWPMDKIIFWKKPWSHLGPPLIVATHLLSEWELARCFRDGRRYDDALAEYEMITFHRRDAVLLREHWEKVHRPPPLPGPNSAEAMKMLYGWRWGWGV